MISEVRDRQVFDLIKADMVDGKLVVTIPMTPLPSARKIAIGDGKKSGK